MEIQQLADMGPSAPVASSRYFHDLKDALEKILDNESQFTHFTIIHGGLGSIRLFLQHPLEDSIDLPRGSSTASEIATELLNFTLEGARYSDNPPGEMDKGWSIRVVTIGPKKAAIAEAAWV